MSALKYVQTNTLYQAGSGNIIGATTVLLTSFSDIYGNVLTMADFGGKGYATAEPDTTNEEAFTFTGVTANANGTYTLTGVSTALAKFPYTETSGLVRQHSGGTKVVITDNVAFWNTFGQTKNTNTWDLVQTFTSLPTIPQVPVAATDAASKNYVDTTAVAGAPNASTTVKGIVELATQAEVDARTTTGGTGALLVPTPDTTRATLYSDPLASTGSANAYVLTVVPAISAYATGQVFIFIANFTNSGAATLNVSGKGAKAIKKQDGTTALVSGDIVSGQVVQVTYDGTNMQMGSPVGNTVLPTIAQNKFLTSTDGTTLSYGVPFDYQVFTSGVSNWTKPSNLTGNEMVFVQAWGGGGGGAGSDGTRNAGGGGGGSYVESKFRASDLTSPVSVTVGAATGAAASSSNGAQGNNSTFGSFLTAYGGGGGGYNSTGNGGGGATASGGTSVNGGSGGSPAGAVRNTSGADSSFGGGNGLDGGGTGPAGSAAWGGGGGAGSNGAQVGGASMYGGGGGGSGGGGAGGASVVYGGTGGAGGSGANGLPGVAPAGGGGGAGAGTKTGGVGARGEVRVWTFY